MIAVLIATYGSDDWKHLAAARAYPSALRENPTELVMRHDPGGTIAQVRNAAAAKTVADWLLFLDADDELRPGYLRAMRQAVTRQAGNPRVLYTPMVSYVVGGRVQRAKFWPEVDLRTGNWLIIGTLVSRSLFNEVGGFQEWPHGLEDFNLWSRCHKAGASVFKVKNAVYLAHRNSLSKHHALMRDPQEHERWRRKAVASVYPELAE